MLISKSYMLIITKTINILTIHKFLHVLLFLHAQKASVQHSFNLQFRARRACRGLCRAKRQAQTMTTGIVRLKQLFDVFIFLLIKHLPAFRFSTSRKVPLEIRGISTAGSFIGFWPTRWFCIA